MNSFEVVVKIGRALEKLAADNERLRAFNESVAVCQAHVAEVTRGGCLVCEAEAANEQNDRLRARLALYDELIMAVEKKCPDETRHQTALRYIRERESSGSSTAQGDGK